MVLRHSSTLHPHHLLAFAKFGSDLQSHEQGENQSPQFQREKKQEGNFQKMAWVSLPAYRSICFGAPIVK